jgi:hypothetical protein
MKRTALLYAGALLASTAQADCAEDPATLAAVYRLNESRAGTEDIKSREIVLWRDGRRAAHEYPDSQVVNLWEATRNDRLRLVRYFDEYARGIEYDPAEVAAGDGESAWQLKRQLVPDALLESLEPVSVTGTDCDQSAHYEWQTDGRHYQLDWLRHRQLPASYTLTSDKVTVSWRLERLISDPAEIRQAFARRDAYQTTDYADIGDNESDPFLQKMINMGFVEHDH